MAPSKSIIGGVITAAGIVLAATFSAFGVLKFSDFKIFHSEGFHDTVASRGFLKNLAEIGKTGLAVLRGTSNFARKLANRKGDERKKNGGGERHFPVHPKKHADQDDQAESFLKEVGEIFGESHARAFDIIDGGGKKPADWIVLKESDGLPDNFCVDLVANIGNGRLSDILNFGQTEIFRDGFCHEQSGERNSEERCDVVETRRQKIIQVHDTVARKREEHRFRDEDGGVKDIVNGNLDHESDHAFGECDESH